MWCTRSAMSARTRHPVNLGQVLVHKQRRPWNINFRTRLDAIRIRISARSIQSCFALKNGALGKWPNDGRHGHLTGRLRGQPLSIDDSFWTAVLASLLGTAVV